MQDEWMDAFIYIYLYSHIDYFILYIYIQMSHIYPFLAARWCKTRRAITSRNETGNFLPWRTHRVRARSPQRWRRWPKKCFLQQQCCRGCGNNINHNHNYSNDNNNTSWVDSHLPSCLFVLISNILLVTSCATCIESWRALYLVWIKIACCHVVGTKDVRF